MISLAGISMTELVEFKTTSQTIINIPERISTKYKDFGLFLLQDHDGSIVDAIRLDCACTYDINEEILLKWLRGKGRKPANWSTLIEVLRKIDLSTLAREIECAKNLH